MSTWFRVSDQKILRLRSQNVLQNALRNIWKWLKGLDFGWVNTNMQKVNCNSVNSHPSTTNKPAVHQLWLFFTFVHKLILSKESKSNFSVFAVRSAFPASFLESGRSSQLDNTSMRRQTTKNSQDLIKYGRGRTSALSSVVSRLPVKGKTCFKHDFNDTYCKVIMT